MRIGQGLDVHPFDDERPLILAGVRISDRGGLAGHSDADVVLHALTDALLGSVAAGDIGEYFPSDDARWKGADSRMFVVEAMRALAERGYGVANLDLTIVAEKPRLAPYRLAMRSSIATILGIDLDQVALKATTTDGMGFTGRGEGIAALAIVLVERAARGTA